MEKGNSPEIENAVGQPESLEEVLQEKGKKPKSAVWEWIETILIALILALILRTFVVQPFQVHLSSMHPTLEEGDFILVNKLAYKLGTPQRGDIVVFMPPGGQVQKPYIKRVIGLPGETVDIKDGKVFVNGSELEEPYALGETSGGKFNHLVVPEGTVFVMGDNRMNSSDSRFFGPVSIASLEGKTFLCFWPFSHFKWNF
ncbi:MAG: signal peptidase I [Coprothermobacterota bacterium]|nr:signal peptidase I [Coprothermobacterota bacterium]